MIQQNGLYHPCVREDQVDKVKLHTRTIKLKINVVGEDKKESWKRVRQISNDAWRAANWIASGQYLNDQLVRRIYARRKIDAKENKDAVEKVEQEFKEFFGTKRQATTERDIKEAYPNLPSCVTNPLNQVVVASYNKEKGDMLAGNRSLRSYRKGMPVTVIKKSIEFSKDDNDKHFIKWKLGRKEAVNFSVYYGKDKANHRLSISNIITGELDYSAPQIQLKDKDLFLLLPVKDPEEKLKLNPELSLGVDLGIAVPAYIALSKGPQKRAVGFKDDFLRMRLQMQNRRRHLQRSLKFAGGGKGRQKKLKALERIKDKERNFARTYNHFLSREIVDFATKNKAGVIKLEMLEGFGKEEQHAFVLRNWSYFELQALVEYKAKRVGIVVVKVDPYHTSQICSSCGNYEEGQRDARKFQCKKCGKKFDADHNAAMNIARSDKVVTKKEQCEFHKRKSSEKNKKSPS
jgi:putative transposase